MSSSLQGCCFLEIHLEDTWRWEDCICAEIKYVYRFILLCWKCIITTQLAVFNPPLFLQIHLNPILYYEALAWSVRTSQLHQVDCQQKPLTYINEKVFAVISHSGLTSVIVLFVSQMEVGGIQNTVIGMLDKQKELDAEVKGVKNRVIVSIV